MLSGNESYTFAHPGAPAEACLGNSAVGNDELSNIKRVLNPYLELAQAQQNEIALQNEVLVHKEMIRNLQIRDAETCGHIAQLLSVKNEFHKSQLKEEMYQKQAEGHVHNIKNMDKCIRRKKRRIENQAAEIDRLNALVLARGGSAQSFSMTGAFLFTVILAMFLQMYSWHPL